MPTVYLIAQPTVSRGGQLPKLEPLAAWGEVRVLVHPGEDPRYNPKRALDRIRSRLADFDPATDYIVWAGGDTLAAVLVGAVLSDFAVDEETPFECFRWLRWERGKDPRGGRTDEGGTYVPITVPLNVDNPVILPDEFDPTTD
jgi:hypothetical protein